MALFLLLITTVAHADTTREWNYDINAGDEEIFPGTSEQFYVNVNDAPASAIVTKIEAKFDYIAYGEVDEQVSATFYPQGYGDETLFNRYSLPDTGGAYVNTFSKTFYSDWDGISVNRRYYFDFSVHRDSPHPCAIKKIYVRITYAEPSISVDYPNGGETLTKGENYTIRWSSSNVSGDVLIHLYRGSSYHSTIAASTTNDGRYSYTFPESLSDRSDYNIGISAMSGTVSDFGNEFTIESPPKSDLVVENESVSPTTVEAGSTISSSCLVTNIGAGSSGNTSSLRYYLSSNTSYGSGDIELNSDSVSSLPSGSSNSENAGLEIPLSTSAGTWYILFRADADDDIDESNESNNVAYEQITVQESLPAPPTLNSPSNYSVFKRPSSITFSWSPVDGAVEYILEIDNDFSSSNAFEYKTSQTSKTISNQEFFGDNIYHWRVRAKNSSGNWGEPQDTYRQFIYTAPPDPPTFNSPTSNAFHQDETVNFCWDKPSDSIHRYWFRIVEGTNVNGSTANGQNDDGILEPSRCKNITLNSTNWDTGTYTAWIKAMYNNPDPSHYSDSAFEQAIGWSTLNSIQFEIKEAIPNIPTNFRTTQISNGIRLTWNASSGVSGSEPYRIYWGIENNVDENNKSGILTTNDTEYDHTGLDASEQYYYRIKACNNSECSDLSSILSQAAPLADLSLTLSIPSSAQSASTIPITCRVSKTGGHLRPVNGYVRIYVYMTQSSDSSRITSGDLIFGEEGNASFDFPVLDLDDGSEEKTKNITIPNYNGEYYIHVKVDGPGYWSESNESNNIAYKKINVEAPRPEIPTPQSPDNYSVFKRPSSITFSWSPIDGAVEYELEIDNDFSSSDGFKYTTSQTSKTIVNEDFHGDNIYHWRVRAKNSLGYWGDPQNTYRQFMYIAPSGSPTFNSPDSRTFRQGETVNFCWDKPSDSIHRYWFRIVEGTNVNGSTANGQNDDGIMEPSKCKSVTFNSSSWDTGTYTAWVKAMYNNPDPSHYSDSAFEQAIGWSTPPASIQFEIKEAIPDIPSNFKANQISNGIRLTWDASPGVNGDEPYRIYWGTNDTVDENNKVEILTTDATEYDHTGCDAGVKYYYRIKACNNSECSDLSSIISQNAPLSDLSVELSGIPDNAARQSSLPITCRITKTGGHLRPDDRDADEGYVRVYIYMNQSNDPASILSEQPIWGEKEAESFDFPVLDLDDGSEEKTKNIVVPDYDGPFYIHVKVDGPNYWNEVDEDNNVDTSSSLIMIWRNGTPSTSSDNGILARTHDDNRVYWISKHGKKWLLSGIADDPGYSVEQLGYTDADIEWYGSGALDSLIDANTILEDNKNFVYRKQGNTPEDSTVFIIRNGTSDWFFNWDTFVNSEFNTEDVYWATEQGFEWIQSIYPPGQMIGLQPIIRVEPEKLYFE